MSSHFACDQNALGRFYLVGFFSLLVAVGIEFYSEMSQGGKCQGHGGKSLCQRRGHIYVEHRPKSEILPYFHFKFNIKLLHSDKEWCNSLHMTLGVDQNGSKDSFWITKSIYNTNTVATKPETRVLNTGDNLIP